MCFKLCAANKRTKILGFTLMRSKACILQNFCIIDSMKLYNQGFPFLYNTFYQVGTKILPGGAGPPGPSPGYASEGMASSELREN
jgi:hypothetical protein